MNITELHDIFIQIVQTIIILFFPLGFSEDQFNFGEGRDKLGNQVKLISETRSYDCDPHKDGNTKTQITCDTR